MTTTNPALQALHDAVTGRIERGEAEAIVEIPAVIDYIEDSSHGWLAVPLYTLRFLGFRVASAGERWPYVGRVISTCSYAKGGMAYLEEDCDASAYMVALDADGIDRPQINPSTSGITPG
jgi:hypothetical protein